MMGMGAITIGPGWVIAAASGAQGLDDAAVANDAVAAAGEHAFEFGFEGPQGVDALVHFQEALGGDGVDAGAGAIRAVPEAYTIGIVGASALLANAASFGILWRFRDGDSNMRSAWICTRNDVLGNVAVLAAALGVFGLGTGWPDVIVASIMAALAIQGAWTVLPQAMAELRSARGGRVAA
jgi:hypothetical protein